MTPISENSAAPSPPVGPEEAGQKILQCLQRRLDLPPAMLHRWIRSGQVRCNGKRCKAFQRLQEGDVLRLPPFALHMRDSAPSTPARAPSSPASDAPPLPELVQTAGLVWAFNKPAGLPVHPGTGHADSLSTRLAAHFPDAPFCPTPAHRLDKDSSGLLLVACAYSSLRMLQEALIHHNLGKEYLAWVDGEWPLPHRDAPHADAPQVLRDHLAKSYTGSHEKVHVLPTDQPVLPHTHSTPATCLVRCLRHCEGRSLLHIRLITGKTHQIRVQLASRGFPLCGDAKYGSRRRPPFKLHALRLILPDGTTFEVLPPWQAEGWCVTTFPPALPESGDGGAVE